MAAIARERGIVKSPGDELDTDALQAFFFELLRKVLLDDELGLCDYFDREVEATIAAYADPWLEREKPVYAGQFEDVQSIPLPVLV